MSQFCRLLTTICVLYLSFIQYTGYEHFSCQFPFQQSCSPFHRNTNTIHNSRIIFFTTCYQPPFLSDNFFPTYHK